MALNQIGGDTTDPNQIVNQMNQNIAELKAQQVTNIFKDDTGTRRVLLGKGRDGFYGLKVSQPNKDVYDGANADMAFSSDNNVFKIVQTGTTSITPPSPWSPGNAGRQRVTIAHNLGTRPAFLVYVENPNVVGVTDYGVGLGLIPNTMFLINSYYTVIDSRAFVDTTNLYIDLVFLNQAGTNLTGANGYTWTYRYYILQETAN